MANLCIIPARGGSKRILRKNIRDFLGKPIISYSITAALNSGLFDEVMVSTDDFEIAEIARFYGASVPFMRSEDTANDTATTVEVLKEVEYGYLKNSAIKFDYICCIYPTAVLLRIADLIKGYRLMIEKKASSVFPIVSFSYPIWRSIEIIDEQSKLIDSKYLKSRTQDMPVAYHDAGQWYWYNPRDIIDQSLFTDKTFPIILNELEVQDIDNESDWQLAELKYRIIHEI